MSMNNIETPQTKNKEYNKEYQEQYTQLENIINQLSGEESVNSGEESVNSFDKSEVENLFTTEFFQKIEPKNAENIYKNIDTIIKQNNNELTNKDIEILQNISDILYPIAHPKLTDFGKDEITTDWGGGKKEQIYNKNDSNVENNISDAQKTINYQLTQIDSLKSFPQMEKLYGVLKKINTILDTKNIKKENIQSLQQFLSNNLTKDDLNIFKQTSFKNNTRDWKFGPGTMRVLELFLVKSENAINRYLKAKELITKNKTTQTTETTQTAVKNSTQDTVDTNEETKENEKAVIEEIEEINSFNQLKTNITSINDKNLNKFITNIKSIEDWMFDYKDKEINEQIEKIVKLKDEKEKLEEELKGQEKDLEVGKWFNKDITKSMNKRINNTKEEIKKAEKNIDNAEKELKKLENENNTNMRKNESKEKKIIRELEKLENEITNKQNELLKEQNNLEKKINNLNREISDLETTIEKIQDKENKKLFELEKKKLEKEKQQKEKELKNINNELKKLNTDKNIGLIDKYSKQLESKIDKYGEQLESKQKKEKDNDNKQEKQEKTKKTKTKKNNLKQKNDESNKSSDDSEKLWDGLLEASGTWQSQSIAEEIAFSAMRLNVAETLNQDNVSELTDYKIREEKAFKNQDWTYTYKIKYKILRNDQENNKS